jgi:hypothetical protein
VKVAIALNPFTPIDIALSVLPHLMLPDLRRAATTRTLKEEVRKSAQTLIEGRGKAVLTVEEVPTHFVAPGGTSVQAMDGGILDIDLEAIEQGLDSWMADPADRRD